MITQYTLCFFFNVTATSEISTLSLHDALPIFVDARELPLQRAMGPRILDPDGTVLYPDPRCTPPIDVRSEEHTSELQSQFHLVCRLLLEKKKIFTKTFHNSTLHSSIIIRFPC